MSTAENSTNVRTHIPRPAAAAPYRPARTPPPVRALRGAMRALTLVSPSLSSRWAFNLFITPRRHARPTREVRLLAEATPIDFVFESEALSAWSWGRGPTVLLVHGWEGRGAQLGAFVDPLVQAGFRVVTFDGPAHGDSPGKQVTPVDLGAAARALADQVGGVHAIVAHSMGSLATSLALQDGLYAERVVFIAPGSHPSVATSQMAALLDLPPSVLLGMREALAARLGSSWAELAAADPFHGHDAPLFIAHDVGDRDVPLREAESIREAWGPAELHRTAGLGHRRILRDPDVVRRAVEFIGAPPEAEAEWPWQAYLRMDADLSF